MLYSLARGGYAPAAWGRVSSRATPVSALLVSAGGLTLALLISFISPSRAFVYLFGISLFGGLYTWLVIFVTHLFFRRKLSLSLLGAIAIAAILLTTWWVDGMRITLIAGSTWLAALSIIYAFVQRKSLEAATPIE
jgi:L-asparagine transporter-like permease